MRQRVLILVFLLGATVALVACGVQINLDSEAIRTPLPTVAPTAPAIITDAGQIATESVMGGAVRLYCRTDCQIEQVYPFREIRFYTDDETLQGEIGEMGRIALAWFPERQPANNEEPVNGTLYIAQAPGNEEVPPNYEYWRDFLIAVQSQLPPVLSDDAPTANMGVIEGPSQNITQIVPFPAGEDGEETLANLIAAMKSQAQISEPQAETSTEEEPVNPLADIAQAQFLLRRSGAEDRLVILLEQTEPPDTPRLCFESSSWLYQLFYCTSFW